MAEELVHGDSARPQVHLLVVHVFDGLLRRHIGESASLQVLVLGIVKVKDSTQPEINNLHIAAIRITRRKQYVLWLEVPVNNRLLVDVVNTFQQTLHDARYLLVAQFCLGLLVKSLELATFDEFHLNHDEPVIFVYLFEVNDGLVV